MTSNETEAVKLEDVRKNVWTAFPDLTGDVIHRFVAFIKARDADRAVLATPQAEPQDEERARRWLVEYWSNDPDVVVHPDDIAELAAEFAAIRAERAAGSRDMRQQDVSNWCAAAFGADHAASIPQRGIRHVEEAIEAAQAAQCEREMIHKLVDYVFDRPVGDLRQEIGGSGLTLLALAQAAGISADKAECAEIARVLAKPLDHFAKRNRIKNDAGFDAAPSPPQEGK